MFEANGPYVADTIAIRALPRTVSRCATFVPIKDFVQSAAERVDLPALVETNSSWSYV